jgi:hypothetical protein
VALATIELPFSGGARSYIASQCVTVLWPRCPVFRADFGALREGPNPGRSPCSRAPACVTGRSAGRHLQPGRPTAGEAPPPPSSPVRLSVQQGSTPTGLGAQVRYSTGMRKILRHGSAMCPHEKYWSVACKSCGRVARKRTTGAHASCEHGKGLRNICKQCGRKSARTNVRASCEHGKQLRNSCKQCGRKSTHNSARSAAVRA